MKGGICISPMLQIVSQTASGQIYTTSLFKKKSQLSSKMGDIGILCEEGFGF